MRREGMSVVEVILAGALFVIVAIPIVGLLIQSFTSNRLGNEETIATQYAAEGLEAVRDIHNRSFSALANSTGTGVAVVGGVWTFSGTSSTFGKYTRIITVSSTFRDVSGNIVASGTPDPDTKQVISTVSWNRGAFTDSVALNTYLTNWRGLFGGGMLVYGNGATTTDAIQYQTFDGQNWSTATGTADVSTSTTNRALRAVVLYSSLTRNEKVMLSRHFDGASQFIYGQVYNGVSSTWGNVQLLSSFSSTALLDVQNFDGTYLANGDFMAIYSDNTAIPKSSTWNGSVWSAQVSMQTITKAPTYIVARARQKTNEVMAAIFDQASSTYTQYFNGGTYATANWALTTHATAAPTSTTRLIDFKWSPASSTEGVLVYAASTSTKALSLKRWTANGSGSGNWSGAVTSGNTTSTLRSLSVDASNITEVYMGCDKDASSTIRCFNSSNAPAWGSPTNNVIAATTDSGIERSYQFAFEGNSGVLGIVVYSDNTATPKYKIYTASTTTFAATATSTSALNASTTGVNALPRPDNNDIIVLLSDATRRLYTIVWDGNAVAMATTTGRAFTAHGTNGSAINEFWYSFAWDTL